MNNNNCGCCNQMPYYNQVLNTCNVEMIPHYTNYHTTHVNNCIKRHVNIPVFTESYETVFTNEYVEGNPIYYPYGYNNPILNNYNYNSNDNYLGNVSTNPNLKTFNGYR